MKYLYYLSYIAFIGIQFLFSNIVLAQEPTIDSQYILVTQQRISRIETDFIYRVKVINSGDAIKNVVATVLSTSENTTIIDGGVEFNDILAGMSSESIDTFTIRQNRRFAFDPNSLIWDIQYEFVNNMELPSDPGEEGLLTIQGIDSDVDGVRDDIQRYIALTYPNEEKIRLALTEVAKHYQTLIMQNDSSNGALYKATNMARHSECLFFITGETARDYLAALRAEILNTIERIRLYNKYSESLAGEIIRARPVAKWKDSCSFDVEAVGGI